MRKIINKYWGVLQINLELRETFLNNTFVALKERKTYKILQEVIPSKMGKYLKPI